MVPAEGGRKKLSPLVPRKPKQNLSCQPQTLEGEEGGGVPPEVYGPSNTSLPPPPTEAMHGRGGGGVPAYARGKPSPETMRRGLCSATGGRAGVSWPVLPPPARAATEPVVPNSAGGAGGGGGGGQGGFVHFLDPPPCHPPHAGPRDRNRPGRGGGAGRGAPQYMRLGEAGDFVWGQFRERKISTHLQFWWRASDAGNFNTPDPLCLVDERLRETLASEIDSLSIGTLS